MFAATNSNKPHLITYNPIFEQDQTLKDFAGELKAFLCYQERILCSLPATFSETLVAHMKRHGGTVETFADHSTLSVSTIKRLRGNEDYNISIKTVVIICISLKLAPALSDDLLRKAGLIFKNTKEHMAYKTILSLHYTKSLQECNELLEACNLPSLTHAQF